MKKIILVCLLTLSVWAADSNVYKVSYNAGVDKVLGNILNKFKAEGLVVVWQLDILEEFKQKGLDKKFGENFNKAGLSAVKTIIVCNGKFGNDIINADSDMMAYCPVRVTLTEKDGVTTVLYVRPSAADKESKAYPSLVELEKKVTMSIEESMKVEK
ncbi:hypothetical protein Suden_1309 [Sulfurimonas denitrificans DSM 1251]|uniref:DUF302 domain-containing protein n=1 Tax=Sulfurimonas denitrificans (strain ATCC 33889 / DSM 1251) TaxID=326298 RepID=Q30QZ4_SULDN|nr:DUF302 domain-containing protein [Sulfurimonas denitrificans]ABB44587.1 hypothetical protein Suden_1309 [Sulfurimonas denitrificans DSM 1251]MDD3441771.1 DUF302 domain-containing protein [Sulfurimonas denitrificans]